MRDGLLRDFGFAVASADELQRAHDIAVSDRFHTGDLRSSRRTMKTIVWLPASAFAKAPADRRSFSGGWSGARMCAAGDFRRKAEITSLCGAAALLLLVVVSSPLHAQVTRLEITSREPVANGQVFGNAGPYENIRYVPFAVTRAERVKAGDSRPSIEERYGTQEGYLCVVRRAADALVRDRFLLKDDAERTVAAAMKARILPARADTTDEELRRISDTLCR